MDREDIFRRDGFSCVYCGVDPRTQPSVTLSVDHVQPRMRGGDNSEGNLVTACVPCNRAKGGKPAWSYLSDLPEERERFLERATHLWPRLRAAVVEAAVRDR